METIKQWVGIDVRKHWLDVDIRPQGASFRVSNNESGIRALLRHLKMPEAIGRVILESTGGYERQVALRLWALDYPVVVNNARQARNFAKAAEPTGEDRLSGCSRFSVVWRSPKPTVAPIC
jgi:transposase